MDDADRAQAVMERQDDALQRYVRTIRARLRPAAADGPKRCLSCGQEMEVPRDACLCCACLADAERAMGR